MLHMHMCSIQYEPNWLQSVRRRCVYNLYFFAPVRTWMLQPQWTQYVMYNVHVRTKNLQKKNRHTIHFLWRRVEDLSNVENSQTNQLDGAPNEIFDGRNVRPQTQQCSYSFRGFIQASIVLGSVGLGESMRRRKSETGSDIGWGHPPPNTCNQNHTELQMYCVSDITARLAIGQVEFQSGSPCSSSRHVPRLTWWNWLE